jgi:serine/threonine-protein kinase
VELTPGALIAERYRLVRKLGEGGMGAVWAATHVITRKPIALKFLKAAAEPAVRKRFLREARAASAVRHKNVIAIHDVVELDDSTVFMVMDLLEGETLSSLIAREGALPPATVAKILLPVVSAVGAAHASGIVHRDLKPDNIFLSRDEDGAVEVKVLDFGIAKLTGLGADGGDTGALTGTGSMLGTPYYMAPEQIYAEKDLDQRIDVWAMGVILFECLTGTRPTEGEGVGQIFKKITIGTLPRLSEVAPELPQDITRVVERMLSRDRDERPKDLSEALATLRRYADVAVQSFPALGELVRPSWPPASPAAALAEAETVSIEGVPTLDVASASHTAAGAVAPAGLTRPRRARWPIAAGVAGAVVLGAIALSLAPRSAVDAPSAPAAAPVLTPSAPPPIAAPPPRPEPAVSLAVPPPSAAAAPVARRTPLAKKSAQAVPSASAAPPPAPSEKPRTPGGVIDVAPF